jgi:hypothetical protein
VGRTPWSAADAPVGPCLYHSRWNASTIEDVRPLRSLFSISAIVLVSLLFGRWAYRELGLRYAEWKLSRELTPGMERQDIENRLLSKGTRFLVEPPNREFVSLGDEVSYSIACAPREVGLMLEFEAQDTTPSGADVLRSVKLVRQERGCL